MKELAAKRACTRAALSCGRPGLVCVCVCGVVMRYQIQDRDELLLLGVGEGRQLGGDGREEFGEDEGKLGRRDGVERVDGVLEARGERENVAGRTHR